MSLYPSLEDMKVDQMIQAQVNLYNQYATPPQPQTQMPMPTAPVSGIYGTLENTPHSLYPKLNDYMGLELSEEVIAANMPELQVATLPPSEIVEARPTNGGLHGMVAPLSGQSLGLKRSQVTHGIRELTLCKDKDGKVGLRVKEINNGIFVCLVNAGSPAALAGLRFGDQILQVNNVTVAGFTMEKVHDLFRKSGVNGISVVVRDRPFERTVTLYKDSTNQIGFQFKNGKIVRLVKDSSAARNGLLTEHQLLEVNGQNVVGMKDKEITKIIEGGGQCVTITVIPTFIYEHMVKKMATSLLKESMDHSIPSI
ncbi:syntenin-1-like [Chrysoperla carnea]|uniref:syntenin-1-like n=1 Tax=Chrysoperla carnea TaxID=189513 RepID=UPI001D08E8EC|nr:syntenin-1-like [Chrysoperla carnea]